MVLRRSRIGTTDLFLPGGAESRTTDDFPSEFVKPVAEAFTLRGCPSESDAVNARPDRSPDSTTFQSNPTDSATPHTHGTEVVCWHRRAVLWVMPPRAPDGLSPRPHSLGPDDRRPRQQIGNTRTENSPIRPTMPDHENRSCGFVDLQLRQIVVRRLSQGGGVRGQRRRTFSRAR